MQEQVLLDFLLNKVTIEVLASDHKNSQKRTSDKFSSVYIDQLDKETDFVINRQHLIKLCNETIKGNLMPEDLNTIAFTLFTSESIKRKEDDQILEDVLFDWDNPEIGFPLTLENLRKWKILSITGN